MNVNVKIIPRNLVKLRLPQVPRLSFLPQFLRSKNWFIKTVLWVFYWTSKVSELILFVYTITQSQKVQIYFSFFQLKLIWTALNIVRSLFLVFLTSYYTKKVKYTLKNQIYLIIQTGTDAFQNFTRLSLYWLIFLARLEYFNSKGIWKQPKVIPEIVG